MDAPPNIIFGVNALLHVLILTTFLVVFFKYYVTKLEKAAIQHELEKAIKNELPAVFRQADSASGNAFKAAVQGMKSSGLFDTMKNTYAMEDPEVTIHNKGLFTSSFIVIIALFLLTALAVFILYKVSNLDIHFLSLLRENAILFIGIGIAEFMFFTKIALHYIPAPPSYMSQQFINTLKTEFD